MACSTVGCFWENLQAPAETTSNSRGASPCTVSSVRSGPSWGPANALIPTTRTRNNKSNGGDTHVYSTGADRQLPGGSDDDAAATAPLRNGADPRFRPRGRPGPADRPELAGRPQVVPPGHQLLRVAVPD